MAAGEVFVGGESGAVEIHHRVPQRLLRLYDEAHASELDGAGIEAWLEFEFEAMRYGVDVDISRDDLAALIEASAVALERSEHRLVHESDFTRWGQRGGLATLRRYGRGWFALLARRRWGKITPVELAAFLEGTPDAC